MPHMQVIEAGHASCTGLSIFLVNALRAVGIPARMTGERYLIDQALLSPAMAYASQVGAQKDCALTRARSSSIKMSCAP